MRATTSSLRSKDLLGIEQLPPDEIDLILDTAEGFKEVSERPVKKVPALRGQLVINLFMEASTRTRVSFEIAEKRLSADTLNFTASGSSVEKGETLIDTAENLVAMHPDMIVIRAKHPGAPKMLADRLPNVSIINAGDGSHEHPTQALLDAFTIRERLGRLAGVNVSIIGDIAHSRVVRSNIHLLTRMKANVTVAAPPTLIPAEIETMGVRVVHSLDEAVEGADVIMMLRIQLERQGKLSFPSLREYYNTFGLTPERLKRANSDAIIMHPGPMNRGVEIASDVADDPKRSVILEQVTNGVAVRMAVLYLLGGAHSTE
ncbi:MAG TPA: aspartate carbamoyltransferase catalytic subunit [Thermoanaerobaculia bacterium]|jgi:aspartate carbamoyltransferase catalytic subunit|nr:aspartate carbamoyltransferase catalytic subunit [Thermoanaerobaculia bacterium]